jgi:hypothetical protein
MHRLHISVPALPGALPLVLHLPTSHPRPASVAQASTHDAIGFAAAMAVQAQYLDRAFRRDHRAVIRSAPRIFLFMHPAPSPPLPLGLRLLIASVPCACVLNHRPALDDDATGSVFLGGDHLLLAQLQSRGNTAFSDLTCGNSNNGCFVPRKRARVADVDAGACRSLIMDGHGGASLLPLPQAFTAAAAGDAQGREHCSGAATTSGASQGLLLSQLHRHAVEIDALVRIEVSRRSVHASQRLDRHQSVRVV